MAKPVWCVFVGIEIDEAFRKTLQKSKPDGIVRWGDFKEAVVEAAQDWILKKNQELIIHGRT